MQEPLRPEGTRARLVRTIPGMSTLLASLAALVLAVQRTDLSPPLALVQADEASYPIEVWLHAQYGLEKDVRPAPGIHVVLGVMPSDGGDEPDALPRELHRPVLAEATSDANGEIHVRVPVPVEWRGRSSFLWARVETPGHTRRVLRLQARDATRAERLVVYRGGTLLGRARTESGEPLADARVWLVDAEGRELAGRTQANGGFALDFVAAGPHAAHARHARLGSSGRTVVTLDPGSSPPELELVARGGAAQRVRVLDPRGEPVPGAWITCLPAGHAVPPSLRECAELEAGGGLCGGRARADRAGRLAFPALLPGVYEARASWYVRDGDDLSLREREPGVSIGRLEVGSAPDEERVLVFPAHRVEVELRDETDAPLAARPDEKDEQGVPSFPALSLTSAPEGSRLLSGLANGTHPAFVAGNLAVFPVAPGSEVLLAWQENERPYLEQRSSMAEQPWRVSVTLRLPERSGGANLELTVQDPEGGPFESPRVTIRAAESGREIVYSTRDILPSMFLSGARSLAPGRYTVLVSSEPWYGCMVPDPLPRAPHLPVRIEVELRAGETRVETIRLGAAGHLDLEAREPTRLPDPSAFMSIAALVDTDATRERLGGLRLVLVAGAERRPIERLDVRGLRPRELDWILPGWSARGLDPLPPGEWTLQAEDRGRVVFSAPVRIEPGRVTSVLW